VIVWVWRLSGNAWAMLYSRVERAIAKYAQSSPLRAVLPMSTAMPPEHSGNRPQSEHSFPGYMRI
jgi:hypothetical protein